MIKDIKRVGSWPGVDGRIRRLEAINQLMTETGRGFSGEGNPLSELGQITVIDRRPAFSGRLTHHRPARESRAAVTIMGSSTL